MNLFHLAGNLSAKCFITFSYPVCGEEEEMAKKSGAAASFRMQKGGNFAACTRLTGRTYYKGQGISARRVSADEVILMQVASFFENPIHPPPVLHHSLLTRKRAKNR